ncbi:hypothetical protein BH09PAT2_BH09PAT2_05270 [soil metagenome]
MKKLLIFLPIIVLAVVYGIFAKTNTLNTVPHKNFEMDTHDIGTIISAKPRDRVISYIVRDGDTLKSIADKFAISQDTIRWANDMQSNDVMVGRTLNIPPVSGTVHTVVAGETIYTVATKYNVDPQNIVNFPFNEFKNFQTFELTPGQTLYVPDGTKY